MTCLFGFLRLWNGAGRLGVRIPLRIARLVKPELVVTGFCYLLPDLVDKPLWGLGIGYGRYVAHTLLFLFLVAIAFSLRKRVYGLFALVGGMTHLLLDWGFVPWFYPFVGYDFPHKEFSDIFTWSAVGKELIRGASIGLAVFLILRLASWLRKAGKSRMHHGSRFNETERREK